MAIEQFDLRGYDIVISSSHAVAKGAITGPEQLHLSYIHSPIRYAWHMQGEYLRSRGAVGRWMANSLLHYIRNWDVASATRPDVFVANSEFIARRIDKVWRRPATVLYPPVDVDFFTPARGPRGDFYVTASRLVG